MSSKEPIKSRGPLRKSKKRSSSKRIVQNLKNQIQKKNKLARLKLNKSMNPKISNLHSRKFSLSLMVRYLILPCCNICNGRTCSTPFSCENANST
jgi:ribosomal protein L31E